MNLNALRAQLIQDEGLRLKSYRDSVGKLTIGVGRNLDDVGISESEALMMLENDIERACADLDSKLPWWRGMSDARQEVLANLCFNMGIGRSDPPHGLLSFRNTLAVMERGDYEAAANGMGASKWATQVGVRATRLIEMMRKG